MRSCFISLRKSMLVFTLILFVSALSMAQEEAADPEPTGLAVLWASGDPDVAHKVCLMYTHAAKQAGWFKEVTLIIWGPSQRILIGDKSLQEKIKDMAASGIKVEACIACASLYGIVEELKALGLEVKGMGVPLTKYLKDPNWSTITF